MFSIGSRRNGAKEMKDLLGQVQSQLMADGLGQEMRLYQHAFVEKTRTFGQFADSFPSEGMTSVGGLSQYIKNAIVQTITPIDAGAPPMPLLIDLSEKMAYTALSIHRVVSEDDLCDKDKVALNEAVHWANKWLSHDARMDYLKKVESRLTSIEQDMHQQGVVKAMLGAEKYINQLTAW
jgi:hypothetical protein